MYDTSNELYARKLKKVWIFHKYILRIGLTDKDARSEGASVHKILPKKKVAKILTLIVSSNAVQ